MFAQLPVVAFLCAVLVLIPFPWHWRAGTVSTLAISVWLFVSNLIFGIDAIIWGDTVLSVAPVWCDIATKIQMGSNVALPAAMFCLCMHLERVSSVRQARTTCSEKRRRQIVDSLLCFGVPAIYMALHYVVQGHRFDIVEGFGCRPTIYVSVASIFLIWVPPLFFSVGACIFAAMAFSHFWRRRATFAKHLQNSNTALTTGRYFRLMCMAIVEMFFGLLVTSLNMWFSLRGGLRPWISWGNVHSNFSEVAYFPLAIIPQAELAWTFALWFMIPIASIIFFGFFAFGQDAMKEYAATFAWIKHNVLRLPDTASAGFGFMSSRRNGGNHPTLPHIATLSSSQLQTPHSLSPVSYNKSEEAAIYDTNSIESPTNLSPAPAYYATSPFSSLAEKKGEGFSIPPHRTSSLQSTEDHSFTEC